MKKMKNSPEFKHQERKGFSFLSKSAGKVSIEDFYIKKNRHIF